MQDLNTQTKKKTKTVVSSTMDIKTEDSMTDSGNIPTTRTADNSDRGLKKKTKPPKPINPHQMLKALGPVLGLKGHIKGLQESVRITSLMVNAKKLVSRCIYVHILKATKSTDILQRFMDSGGWQVLNVWLYEAKKIKNVEFVAELLSLFLHLPLTIDILKENNSAKLVKQLSKDDSTSTTVRELACSLVNDWLSLIKTNTASTLASSTLNNDKSKKKRLEDKPPSQRSDGKKSRSENGANKGVNEPSSNKAATTTTAGDKKKLSAPPHARFRTTGLETEGSSKQDRKSSKETPVAVKRPPSSAPVGGKVGPEPPEKKTKLSNSKSQAPVETKVQPASKEPKIKLIPPKPMVVESAGFMDALQSSSTPLPVRKKVIRKNSTSSSAKVSSPNATPPKMNPLDAIMKSTEMTHLPGASSTGAARKSSSSTPPNRSPAGSSGAGDTVSDRDPLKEGVEDDMASVISGSDPSEQSSLVGDNSSLKSSLSSWSPKRKRKSVTWRPDDDLCEVTYFDVDADERANVHRQNFQQAQHEEMLKEKEFMKKALRSDTNSEESDWPLKLQPIELPKTLVEFGGNSTEKDLQRERESTVLAEIYFTRECIPDSPKEPESNDTQNTDTKEIPLEDEGGMVIDHTQQASAVVANMGAATPGDMMGQMPPNFNPAAFIENGGAVAGPPAMIPGMPMPMMPPPHDQMPMPGMDPTQAGAGFMEMGGYMYPPGTAGMEGFDPSAPPPMPPPGMMMPPMGGPPFPGFPMGGPRGDGMMPFNFRGPMRGGGRFRNKRGFFGDRFHLRKDFGRGARR